MTTACSNAKPQSIKTNPYDGRRLSIGIIGEPPKVREKQVKFVKIQFPDLEKAMFDSKYDAIFITKDNLSQASQDKYKSIYKKSKIPFFFIQTKKSYIPFTVEGLTYDKVPDMEDLTYATGIIYVTPIINCNFGDTVYTMILKTKRISKTFTLESLKPFLRI